MRWRAALGGLVLQTILAGVLPGTTGAVVCQRPGGELFQRDTCKRKEVAVDLATLGALGPTGSRGVGVRLVDATGKQVGHAVRPIGEGGGSFAYRVGDQILASRADAQGFSRFVEFAHESATCTGPRLMLQDPTRLTRFAYIDGMTAYFAGDPVESHAILAFEYSSDPADCMLRGGTPLADGFCCEATMFMITAGPVATFDLGTLGVTPPFHLERGP